MKTYTKSELNALEADELHKTFHIFCKETLTTLGTDDGVFRKELENTKVSKADYPRKGHGTCTKLYNDTNRTLRIFDKKKTIIDFILFFQFAFFNIPKEDNEKVVNTESSPDSGSVYYDFFYWRIKQDNLGIAKIKIDNAKNWNSGKMRVFYKTTPREYIDLSMSVWEHGHNIYIKLENSVDSDSEGSGKNINSLVVLFHSGEKKERNFIMGCFVSANRDSDEPNSSLVVLKKSLSHTLEKSDYMDDFGDSDDTGIRKRSINKVVPNEISYFLQGNRLIVDKDFAIVKELSALPLATDANKLLKYLVGDYQNIYFSLGEAQKKIISTQMTIKSDGIVYNYVDDDTKDVGRLRYLDKNNIVIQFIHDKLNNTYRYYLFLNTAELPYLKGSFIGLVQSQIISCRNLSIKKGSSKIVTLPIESTTSVKDVISSITDNDTNAVNFFSDNDFDNFTDTGLKKLFNHPSSVTNTTEVCNELVGRYECFFSVKQPTTDPTNHDISTFPIGLRYVPLVVESNSAYLKYMDIIVNGTIHFDGIDKALFTFIHPRFYITILITIDKDSPIKHIVGSFNSISKDNEIQSSFMAMVRKDDLDFAKAVNFTYKSIDDLKMLDAKYSGLATRTFGDWNRIIHIHEKNNIDFKVRLKAYRRTFWNSACFTAIKLAELSSSDSTYDYKVKEYRKLITYDIYRAYRHGFAMRFFSKKDYDKLSDKSQFDQELVEEIKMVDESLDRYFTDSVLNLLVSKLWKS